MSAPKTAANTLPAWTGGGRLGGIWSQNRFQFRKKRQHKDKPIIGIPFLEKREHPMDTRANMDIWAGRQRYNPRPSSAPYPYFSTGEPGFDKGSFRQYLFRNAGLIPNQTGAPVQLRGTYDPSGHKGRFAFSGRNKLSPMSFFRPPREVRRKKKQ
jgi:hypothetical protein